jgi:hypothetical protein
MNFSTKNISRVLLISTIIALAYGIFLIGHILIHSTNAYGYSYGGPNEPEIAELPKDNSTTTIITEEKEDNKTR